MGSERRKECRLVSMGRLIKLCKIKLHKYLRTEKAEMRADQKETKPQASITTLKKRNKGRDFCSMTMKSIRLIAVKRMTSRIISNSSMRHTYYFKSILKSTSLL